VKRKI